MGSVLTSLARLFNYKWGLIVAGSISCGFLQWAARAQPEILAVWCLAAPWPASLTIMAKIVSRWPKGWQSSGMVKGWCLSLWWDLGCCTEQVQMVDFGCREQFLGADRMMQCWGWQWGCSSVFSPALEDVPLLFLQPNNSFKNTQWHCQVPLLRNLGRHIWLTLVICTS